MQNHSSVLKKCAGKLNKNLWFYFGQPPRFLEVCEGVRACVCVCMFKNIRPISQKAKRTPKDNTRPFQKFYTLKLKI